MSDDAFILGGKVRLRQIPGGFHTGLDAVMLAASCHAVSGQRVLDLGCGVGGAGLAVLARVNGAWLAGVDVQADHVDMAQENAAMNGFSSAAQFVCVDIRDFRERSFDHAIINPPYMKEGAYIRSPRPAKDAALGLSGGATLHDWVACAFDCLRGRGRLSMIHRGDMVDKVIYAFGKRFGEIEVIPLWPRAGVPAKRVIVRGIKHAKGVAIMQPGLVLHDNDGEYTAQADAVLKGDKALF